MPKSDQGIASILAVTIIVATILAISGAYIITTHSNLLGPNPTPSPIIELTGTITPEPTTSTTTHPPHLNQKF